jgi:hypothetical protein
VSWAVKAGLMGDIDSIRLEKRRKQMFASEKESFSRTGYNLASLFEHGEIHSFLALRDGFDEEHLTVCLGLWP